MKCRFTERKLQHSEDPTLFCQFNFVEHALIKGIPASLVGGLSETVAYEVLGQSVGYAPFVAVGELVAKTLKRIQSVKKLPSQVICWHVRNLGALPVQVSAFATPLLFIKWLGSERFNLLRADSPLGYGSCNNNGSCVVQKCIAASLELRSCQVGLSCIQRRCLR